MVIDGVSIIGCGGHARSVADVLICNNNNVNIVFYDKQAGLGEKMFSQYGVFPICSDFKYKDIFLAVGDNLVRKEYAERYLSIPELNILNVVSKMSYVSPFSSLDKGVFIASGAYVGPEVHIGEFTIINTKAVVEHEAKIGAYSHISVNATVCGRTEIGNNVFIGAGAVVKDKLYICDNVTIGAGGVVCSDIIEPGTYVGCPVRRACKR